MVLDELLLLGGLHGGKGVEGTLEVTLEGLASLDNLIHDFVTLGLGDTGAEGVAFEVATNANTGGDNHGGLVSLKRGGVEGGGVHVRDVGSFGAVLVVVLDDLVKELGEGLVRVVGASIGTDAGVDVLASGEDTHLEWNTGGILLVLVLIPNFLGKVLGDEGAGLALGEQGPVDEIVAGLEPGTAVGPALDGGRLGDLGTGMCVLGR
jgi:hypothetical protein